MVRNYYFYYHPITKIVDMYSDNRLEIFPEKLLEISLEVDQGILNAMAQNQQLLIIDNSVRAQKTPRNIREDNQKALEEQKTIFRAKFDNETITQDDIVNLLLALIK